MQIWLTQKLHASFTALKTESVLSVLRKALKLLKAYFVFTRVENTFLLNVSELCVGCETMYEHYKSLQMQLFVKVLYLHNH